MSATYEIHDGCTTCISDAGRDRLAEEQRQRQAEILMWTTAGSIGAIAALVLKQLLGG